MSTLLHISVSPMGDHSISRGIAGEFVTAWTAAHADGVVIDLRLPQKPFWRRPACPGHVCQESKLARGFW